jgi:PTH1 family peptidyl-tRNA hydrolase
VNWFLNIFKRNTPEENIPMKKFLIVGLGNIGSEYANTRHNIGFKIVDFIANQEGVSFQNQKLGDVAELKIKGRTILLLKPNTYMNLSGKAVNYWLEKEKIEKENLLVITDDLNLAFGTIRIKTKGSDGGHNGLKNIQLLLNSTEYPRFRFGISDAFKKGKQVDYVLGEWDDTEKEQLKERLALSAEIVKSFALAGLNNTMNLYNGK